VYKVRVELHGNQYSPTRLLKEYKQVVLVVTRYAPPLSSPVGAPAPRRARPSRRNVAVVSHAQYILTVTAALASRVKAAVSKAAW